MDKLDLTTDEWQRADALARELAKDVDRNEFAKVVTYMRRTEDQRKVAALLQRLPHSTFIRSNQTKSYLERIGRAWVRHLNGLKRERALLVASWAFRLMTYYQEEYLIKRFRR
jgi:hypothetical protein